MAISFSWLNCGKSFKAPDDMAGKKILCPGCREILEMPDKPEPTAAREVSPE